MDKTFLDKFGPCGILCEKCFAFEDGPIRLNAGQLKYHLGEFDVYASRFVSLLDEPVFGKYPDFKEVLNLFSANNCKGCRKQECHLFKGCKVRHCHKEKEVDFCFQCPDFPCENTGFDENLLRRWLFLNQRIREIGLATYYDEIKDKPRY